MQIRVENEETVQISGYVNAVERNSKPIWSRMGKFIERIAQGAFKKALARNNDVHILLNHNWQRDLGSTKKGNLKLTEDNIGLRAEATLNDKELVNKAKNGDLIGWSFGFSDRDVENTTEHDTPVRIIRDLELFEVSILDRAKRPAYTGTLLSVREETGEPVFSSAEFLDEAETRGIAKAVAEENTKVDYKEAEKIINEIKGGSKNE